MTEDEAFLDGSRCSGNDDNDSMVQSLLDREERCLLALAPPVPDGIDEWRPLVADTGFVRRSSVLARGAPLHRIAQRQAWQRFPRDLYDPRTLALAALEAVVSRQEMQDGALTDLAAAVDEALCPVASRVSPLPSPVLRLSPSPSRCPPLLLAPLTTLRPRTTTAPLSSWARSSTTAQDGMTAPTEA